MVRLTGVVPMVIVGVFVALAAKVMFVRPPPGMRYEQANGDGVNFSIRQTMSWQVWWRIPIEHVQREDPLLIG